jgi:hypothetical protein
VLDSFETAAGTTAGNKHRGGILQSNQDAVLVHRTPELLTLTVSDGVSAAPRSHVASDQQVEWFTQLAHAHALTGEKFDEDVWHKFADEIANRIRTIASWSHLTLEEAVARTWAATIGSIVIGPEFTHLVAFGDVRFLLNGELIVIEAANTENNQPACVAYLVVPSTLPIECLKFTVITRRTEEIENAAIATDGLDYLIKSIGKRYPGTTEKIPGLSHMWEEDKLYEPQGPDNWLTYLARDYRKPGNPLTGGKLYDDLAFAATRRKRTLEV